MVPRFFAPDAGRSGADALVTLPEDEALHLTRVMRLKPGDAVRVFDGQGREWRGEVSSVGRQRAVIALVEPIAPVAEPRIPITLAVAVLKGDKMDGVVRDAVMLGATAIQPLVSERTEFSLATIARSRRAERWQRIAIASAKQCGRAVVPPVHQVQAFDAWMGTPVEAERVMLVEPAAGTSTRGIAAVPQPNAASLIVGPEGGWTAEELRTAAGANAHLVTMGERTLRADAVPIVALTAVRTLWQDF